MKVLAVEMSKGGPGKTTLAFTLAVEAVKEGSRVALLDLDGGQGSLTAWWLRRGEPDNPEVFDLDWGSLESVVTKVENEGFDWLIIDGPPLDMDLMDAAMIEATAALIPVRPSFLETAAVDSAVEIAKRRGKPFAFVLNAVDTRVRFRGVVAATERALEELGPILPARLTYQPAYMRAPAKGKSAAEIDSSLEAEARAVWLAAKALAGGGDER